MKSSVIDFTGWWTEFVSLSGISIETLVKFLLISSLVVSNKNLSLSSNSYIFNNGYNLFGRSINVVSLFHGRVT